MEVDVPDVCVIAAFTESRRMAYQTGEDYGAYVGAAWLEAVKRIGLVKDVKNPIGLARIAARYGVRRSRHSDVCQFSKYLSFEPDRSNGFTEVIEVLDREYNPSPEERVSELWEDTKEDRRYWPMRTRMFLYMYAVEGWTALAIAAACGVCVKTVLRDLQWVVTVAGVPDAMWECRNGRGGITANNRHRQEHGKF